MPLDKNNYFNRLLIDALRSNHIEIAIDILKKPSLSRVSSCKHQGNTALHYAAINNNIELARLLLEKGADPEIKNNEGHSVIDLAKKNNFLNINVSKCIFEDDYYIKTIRADTLSFWRKFILSITRTSQQRVKLNLRQTARKKYVVNAEGVHLYVEKPSRYKLDEIKFHSPPQSTTLVTQDFQPAPFGFGTGGGGDRKEKLVGVIFNPNSQTKVFTEDLFRKDCATVNRPNYFNSDKNAQQYYQENVADSNPFLFSDLTKFKKHVANSSNKNHHNEALARLKWDKQTDYIFIGSDNLESRLLAQDYARSLRKRLKIQAQENNELWDENYYVPICYYLPNSPKHLDIYTIFDQAADRKKALLLFNSKSEFKKLCEKKDYELLLGLIPQDLITAVKSVCPPENKNLILQILEDGYVHIAQSLIEKAQTIEPDILTMIDLQSEIFQADDPDSAAALYHCSRAGNTEFVNWLLKYQNIPTVSKNFNPLISAAQFGQHEIIKILLQNANIKAHIDQLNPDKKMSALIVASVYGHEKIIKELLNNGAQINNHNAAMSTALIVAAQYGHLEALRYLLSLGADINMHNTYDKSALHYAIEEGFADIVNLLLLYESDFDYYGHLGGADIKIHNIDNNTNNKADNNTAYKPNYTNAILLLDLLFAPDVDPDIVEAVINTMGSDKNAISLYLKYYSLQNKDLNLAKEYLNNFKKTYPDSYKLIFQELFLYACRLNNLSLLENLLEEKNDIEDFNKKYGEGESTALMFAAQSGHKNIIEKLISQGANVNALDDVNKTALMYAAENGNANIVEKLIAHGANINDCDSNNQTALILACNNNHYNVVKLLLNSGANIYRIDNNGNTAFHSRSRKIKKLLNATKYKTKLSIFHAAKNGYTHTFEKLINDPENQTPLDSFNKKNKMTVLMLAAQHGHTDIVKILLEKSVDTNIINSEQKTALIYAIENNFPDIVKLLIENNSYLSHLFINPSHTIKFLEALFSPHPKPEIIEAVTNKIASDKNAISLYLKYYSLQNENLTSAKEYLESFKNTHPDNYKEIFQELFLYACSLNNLNLLENLLKEKINFNKKYGEFKKTALMYASQFGHEKVVEKLIDSGVNVNALANENETALMYAAASGNPNIVEKLIAHDANVNTLDNLGKPALTYAAQAGHILIADKLIKFSADIDASSTEKNTTLLLTIVNNQLQANFEEMKAKTIKNNLINKLQNYIIKCQNFKPHIPLENNYYSFWGKYVKGADYNAKNKIDTAQRCINYIKNGTVDFSASHVNALKDGKLGKIFKKDIKDLENKLSYNK